MLTGGSTFIVIKRGGGIGCSDFSVVRKWMLAGGRIKVKDIKKFIIPRLLYIMCGSHSTRIWLQSSTFKFVFRNSQQCLPKVRAWACVFKKA
jgi:hypothetical protein